MTRTISSQRHLNEAIVLEKLAAQDYAVTVSPEFAIEGERYRVIVDGHHSLEAARRAGVEPEITEATPQMADTVALLERGLIEDYLQVTYIDSPYYDIATGQVVW